MNPSGLDQAKDLAFSRTGKHSQHIGSNHLHVYPALRAEIRHTLTASFQDNGLFYFKYDLGFLPHQNLVVPASVFALESIIRT
ncbi:MAG: hypothetical protein ACT4O9_15735 [Blastocatellia bacterium]